MLHAATNYSNIALLVSISYTEMLSLKGIGMKLYTATIDYTATGEGRTMSFLAVGAEDEASARDAFVERCGEDEYFMRGATVYEGLPPPGDPVTMYLVSDPLYEFLKGQAQTLSCTVVTRVAHHFNYS